MANQEQNPPQQEQPFVVAKQVGFNLEDIILNTNNEVALLYPVNNNKDHFESKALENSKVFFSTPTGGIYGEVRVNTFRNVIGAHYLPHFSEYVAPPSIDIVRPWFDNWVWRAAPAKGTLKKSLLPPRWRLLMAQIIQFLGGKTGGFDRITNKDAIILEATKGGSSKAPTSSKTCHSDKTKESNSTMDSNPSQPPVSIPVDTEMHKEDQQANDGPTSLRVTSKAKANPQLSSAASTAEADPEKSTPSDFVPQQQGMNEGTKNTSYDHLFAGKGASFIARHVEEEEASSTIKLEDLKKLVSKVKHSFKNLDSPEDDPVIVVDDCNEDGEDVHTTTEDTSVSKSSSHREVVKVCPNKKGKGWMSIYKQIQERMDHFRTTKVELGINLDRPLSEQDLLDRLDLTNKKRKRADDIHDFFKANKRLKSSVKYEDHPSRINVYKTCNKKLEHEMEDELEVVVVKEVHEYSWRKKGESFWEGGDDFGVDVLRFHTCLIDILGFLEKLEWWFKQDIDKEEERFEEMKMVVKYES
nr:hypothetical protein [Tanacetum cinerariifolium]